MDSAVGVPKELAAKDRGELTPMISQYVELCEEYDSELLLFHVGDFYKAFGEAAETVARLCELTLTSRKDNTGEYKMAGLRVDSAETHLQTLLDAGFRIAIAEQVEDPNDVSGVAERAVTQVITPGTLTEAELLDPVEPNYVLSVTQAQLTSTSNGDTSEEYGVAFLDVSTGAFFTTSLSSLRALKDEVSRIAPVEAILGPDIRTDAEVIDSVFGHMECEITEYDTACFEESYVRAKVADYFGQLQGSTAPVSEATACGSLLEFAEYTRGGENGHLDYITQLTRYDPQEYMRLNDVAVRGLELFERRAEQSPEGATLVDVLDDCASALGSRKLREWLRRPLVSRERIEERHDTIEELITDEFTRSTVRDLLTHVYDIERLSSQIARNRANARDIRSLHETLAVLPEIRECLAECDSPLLATLHDQLPVMVDLREHIDEAIKDDPATELTEGGIIKEGYNRELDELRATVRENEEWIENLETKERERTGIDNLRVGHTEVHGYYIEVTQSHLDDVPADYTRRQTLKEAERFYTPELQEREQEIITAEQRANDLEYELFLRIRDALGEESERFQAVADQVACLDVLANFAEIATFNEYTRPEMAPAGSGISIEEGRHPVVEQTQESFVPNGTNLDRDSFLAVITGPNMSGKSTYLRQVALITLLAQCGSFVPATNARIGITDQILTRIGASDDITGGQSTFMVEMSEMADILESATEHSLVLLDEVGRGTSTADGYALACAVTKYIHDEIGATTLFATHHHELTQLDDELGRMRNLHFSAEQHEDGVIFHYNVSEGPATGSYGINVAKEAGIPAWVIHEANEMLAPPESGENPIQFSRRVQVANGAESRQGADDGTIRLDPELAALIAKYDVETITEVIQEIQQTDIVDMTPLEALEALDEIQQELDTE